MSDENNVKSNDQNETPAPEEPKHSLKKGLREGAAKAWGIAVEAGSLLGGESGQIVDAEREIAEANAEELIDRLDGEG